MPIIPEKAREEPSRRPFQTAVSSPSEEEGKADKVRHHEAQRKGKKATESTRKNSVGTFFLLLPREPLRARHKD